MTDFVIGEYFIIDLITLKMYNIADQFSHKFFWRLGFCVYGFCWLEVGDNTSIIIINPSDDSSLRRLAKNDKNKTFNSLSDEFLGEQSSIKILNITLAQ